MRAALNLDTIPPLPWADPTPPAMASSSGVTTSICSMSVAVGSVRGSAVNSPAVSVSSTSTSAPTMWATSAAMRSLSPKRSSSSAMASFSFTTGTTASSSRRVNVSRAWRYCDRAKKSLGVSSTWPLTMPWAANESSHTRIKRL